MSEQPFGTNPVPADQACWSELPAYQPLRHCCFCSALVRLAPGRPACHRCETNMLETVAVMQANIDRSFVKQESGNDSKQT